MSPDVRVVFPFVAVAKARPRFARGKAYTDQKTRDFETSVRTHLLEVLPEGFEPLQGPLAVTLDCYFVPRNPDTDLRFPAFKAWGKFGGSDVENYGKSALDGANGVLWVDDVQIVDLQASKNYATEPSFELSVWKLHG